MSVNETTTKLDAIEPLTSDHARKMAPTHPHPNAPNTPPGNVVGGAAAAVTDGARDTLRRD